MTPEQIDNIEAILLLIITIELTILVLFVVTVHVIQSLNPPEIAMEYLRNCNNLTLYPDGCQVFT